MGTNPKSHVLSACRVLLRPVVRLLLKSGVPWKDFAEVSKAAYVEVATNEFGIRGRPTNVSRVAILTGIGRREVGKQRAWLDEVGAASEPAFMSPAQRLLSAWHQDPAYLDESGTPLEIAVDGETRSFADLARRYASDVPAVALLKELRSVGAVSQGNSPRLRVLQRVYMPAQFDPQKVIRAGGVLEDLGNTVVFDVLADGEEPLRFERRAENDRVRARDLPAFREFLAKEGQAFLERVDDWLTAHEQKPAEDETAAGTLRLGVGVYHIQTDPKRGTKT
jgi:hypothetical protein